jgi:hypothetical protein
MDSKNKKKISWYKDILFRLLGGNLVLIDVLNLITLLTLN